jgi:uncharacterized protein (UPF0335 family)
MADADSQKIVSEIEHLESHISGISDNLKAMKAKAQSGQKITADELKLTVTNINRLDLAMRERQDVGH